MDDLPRLDNYDILRLIAEGGTAKVYFGIDLRSGFPVAIKELKLRHMGNAVIRDKFRNMETQLMLYAQHPNIPKIVDFIDLPERNQMFLVMEYIKGRNLFDYIRLEIGLIPEQKALPMFLEILNTVGFLHRAYIPHMGITNGVLHLDIKSNNVMLQSDGKIKLIDLGIASRLGTSGFTVGTPWYMAPEQWSGGTLGKYTDIFALGILLFEMLIGQMPFNSDITNPHDSRQEIRSKIEYYPTPQMYQFYPPIGSELQLIVERALAKSPSERYQSCEIFANFIKDYMKRKGYK